MSIESVRAFPVEHAPEITPIALERDSETRTLSTAWGVKPVQIAKTLVLPIDDFAAVKCFAVEWVVCRVEMRMHSRFQAAWVWRLYAYEFCSE